MDYKEKLDQLFADIKSKKERKLSESTEQRINCGTCGYKFSVPSWLNYQLYCPKCQTPVGDQQEYHMPPDKSYGPNTGPRDFLGSLNRPPR